MKIKVLTAALAAVVGGGSIAPDAHARPDTRTMSCAAVNQLVEREGAVVMSTGRHTFERFASSGRFCDRGERIEPRYVPAADTKQCIVNGVCTRNDIFDSSR